MDNVHIGGIYYIRNMKYEEKIWVPITNIHIHVWIINLLIKSINKLWFNECMNLWMYECIIVWMHYCMNKRMDQWINEPMSLWLDE